MITARNRYTIHKNSAKSRGIDFNLTYEEWYNWWLSNGVDKNFPTDNGPNRPCMCRYGDTGPYSLDNIYFDTLSNNIIYANTGKRRWSKKISTPKGVFDSTVDAAKSLNVSRKYIYRRIKENNPEYFYV